MTQASRYSNRNTTKHQDLHLLNLLGVNRSLHLSRLAHLSRLLVLPLACGPLRWGSSLVLQHRATIILMLHHIRRRGRIPMLSGINLVPGSREVYQNIARSLPSRQLQLSLHCPHHPVVQRINDTRLIPWPAENVASCCNVSFYLQRSSDRRRASAYAFALIPFLTRIKDFPEAIRFTPYYVVVSNSKPIGTAYYCELSCGGGRPKNSQTCPGTASGYCVIVKGHTG
jgi:hypothetical protein